MSTDGNQQPSAAMRPSAKRPAFPRLNLRIGSSGLAALTSAAVLLPLYLATAAPDMTFWDAPEFMTAAHTLGIPHPPGTPLWVLTAKVSALAFASRGPARAVTLLSVIATVLACALAARLVVRWLHGRAAILTALVAAVGAGTMTSVWANATETEVYAMSLLLAVAMISAGDWAGQPHVSDDQRQRGRALLAFLVGITVPMHLSAMVALPAAIALGIHAPRVRMRDVLIWIALALLGFSAVAVLPIRAHHSPELNVGNPVDLKSLYAVLTRAQYAVAGLWPRRAPLWIQFGNLFEYADWQVAFGIRPTVGPSWLRTPFTVLWGVLGILGLRHLWRAEKRVGRGVAVLLICATAGVVVWLNLRAGPSFGDGYLERGAIHEARERDYFFALGFWTWGLLSGIGIASSASLLTARLSRTLSTAARAAMLAVGAIPLVANATVMDRSHEPLSLIPRTLARTLLESVPHLGVLVVAGDNDTNPHHFLQQVEHLREDVTIVTTPLLGASWHREALERRGVIDMDHAKNWYGDVEVLNAVGAYTLAKKLPLRVSVYLSKSERNRLRPGSGWVLQGVVYAPSTDIAAGTVGLDLQALARARGEMPPSFLKPFDDYEGAATMMQRLLSCTQVMTLDNPLLAGPCNGG